MGDNGNAAAVFFVIIASLAMGVVEGLLVLIGIGWVCYRLWYYFTAKDYEDAIAYECPYHPGYYIKASPLTGETISDCMACREDRDRDAEKGKQARQGSAAASESRSQGLGQETRQPELFMGD